MVHHVASTYGYTLDTIAGMTRPQLRLLTRGAGEIGEIQKQIHDEHMQELRSKSGRGHGLDVGSPSRTGGKDNRNINPGNILSLLTMPGFEATPKLKAYIKRKAEQRRIAQEKNKNGE